VAGSTGLELAASGLTGLFPTTAAAPTRGLPGPLSAGRSAIPVGCGCAGSAARRFAPLSAARAPPRGAPARRTAHSAWDQLRRTARRRARADRLRLRASSSSCQTSSELGHALVPRVPPVSLAGLPWSSVPLALRELLDLLLRHRLQPRQKGFHLPLRHVIGQDEFLRLRPDDVGHPVVQARRAPPGNGEPAERIRRRPSTFASGFRLASMRLSSSPRRL